ILFSVTIRLNTSLTDRTPWPGRQSYLPAITRASPVNLSERFVTSFTSAARVSPAGAGAAIWAAAGAANSAPATARAPTMGERLILTDIDAPLRENGVICFVD